MASCTLIAQLIMVGLSDLDFQPGLGLEKLVSQRFGSPVSPPPSHSNGFLLVANFGRSAVRLNVDSVGLILQSCIGGVAKDFQVMHLSRWMYRFSISRKEVGFLIYKFKSFICKNFAVFFFLWGNGRPNWKRELDLWNQEQQAEWTTVGTKKSYADVVRSPPLQKPQSVFLRLNYPSNYHLNYGFPGRFPRKLDRSSNRVLRSDACVPRWSIKTRRNPRVVKER